MTEPDPSHALPEAWSASAKTTYLEIEAENSTVGAASLASLYEACGLLANADAMSAQIAADGFMVRGSRGQPVAHPLIAEERMSRVAAIAALRALGLARNQSSASQAGAALAARRHRASS